MYQDIKKAAVENEVLLCDQFAMLGDAAIPSTPLFTKDRFHPNAHGYQLMAEFLLKTMEERGIIFDLLNKFKNS